MKSKIEAEYIKYSNKTLTQVEKDYLEEIEKIKELAEKSGVKK